MPAELIHSGKTGYYSANVFVWAQDPFCDSWKLKLEGNLVGSTQEPIWSAAKFSSYEYGSAYN